MARRAVSTDEKEKQFLNVVAEMATAAGMKPPTAYVVPDADLNAFATGISPENSVIAVTEGLLSSLNRQELQAVVAHEMSHIKNYDMRLMTVAAALMGAIALISDLAGRSMRLRYGRSSYGGSSSGSSSGSSGARAAAAPMILRLRRMDRACNAGALISRACWPWPFRARGSTWPTPRAPS